jgi:hypothetical protein
MKLLASIFLFYLSTLMAQPMITLLHNSLMKEDKVCMMACCQKHKAPENKQTPKSPFGCCNNDMSNPFAQCCCCTGFLSEKQNMGITALIKETNIVYTNTGILVPNYSSDCWRPPEWTA